MNLALVSGSAGLIGSETVRFFAGKGLRCVGIDNDLRGYFFGQEASTRWNRQRLEEEVPGYRHHELDIRDYAALERLFQEYGSDLKLIVHTAAQPSHDWAAREPLTDFGVNATGTLHMLELTRRYCPQASFIFTSTNKVYGDLPNLLPLVEQPMRWEVAPGHAYAQYGIDESMSIDQSKHSLFGVSKVAADVMVQEYGRYFDMHTVVFRGGCLTGPAHSGTQLHGFLAYLVKCALTGAPYTVFGYKGKQVRDNIHAADLVSAFYQFYLAPRSGEVYNMGGSRHSHCSMLEAIALVEELSGKRLNYQYSDQNRSGDHIWYVSDVRKFQTHYPDWHYQYDLRRLLAEICTATESRLAS